MKRKKCYIYTRVSTAAQTEGYSLDAQQKRLKDFAEYKGLKLPESIVTLGNLDTASRAGLHLWR